MAYILQHRRDTLENWKSVNPVLADAEIGYILDLDENGKQKSSLYKIGDGRTAWNDLPLFGFGGNVHDDFAGNDLNISVASRQAVLDKIAESESGVREDLDKISSDLEAKKADKSQIVQEVWPVKLEQFGDLIYNPDPAEGEPGEPLTWEQMEPYMRQQVVSRYEMAVQLQETWNDFGDMEERQNNFDKTLTELTEATNAKDEELSNSVQSVTDSFNEFKPVVESTLEELSEDLDSFKTTTETTLDEHDKFINGYDEQTGVGEDEQPIITHHKGVDEKIADVDTKADTIDAKVDALRTELLNRHQVVTEQDFARLDFTQYPEGTLFYTYKVQ